MTLEHKKGKEKGHSAMVPPLWGPNGLRSKGVSLSPALSGPTLCGVVVRNVICKVFVPRR